jgi:hypothetical protein
MYHRAPHTTFTLSPPKTKNGGAAGTEGGGYHHHHQLEAATGATMEHSTGGYSSGHSRCGSTYQQAIVEIYECLYQLQRERTHSQEAQVVDCISKWYELNAVFENPFTRASGIHAIIAQFSLMSLIPGRIWSELGDICESEDYSLSFFFPSSLSHLRTTRDTTDTTHTHTHTHTHMYVYVYFRWKPGRRLLSYPSL